VVSHPSTNFLDTDFVGLLDPEAGTLGGDRHCVSFADSKAGSNAAKVRLGPRIITYYDDIDL
jgi:hypothetical protein